MSFRAKMTVLLLFSIVIGCIAGCPESVDIVYPIQLEDSRLGLEQKWSDKRVVQLKILTCLNNPRHKGKPVIPAWFGPCKEADDFGDIPDFECVWHIRATAEVLAKDFRFIPGIVPSGFEQVLPNGYKRFNPIKGRIYFLLICLDPIDDSVYSIGKQWIP